MADFTITEKWLMEAGGWQAIKRARLLVDRGKVLDATFDGKLLKGTIAEGKRNLRTGLIIRGRTDVETLCSCAEARRSGSLCHHALALGVSIARGTESPPSSSTSRPKSRGKEQHPKASTTFTPPAGALSFHFAKNFAQALEKGSIGAKVEADSKPDDAAFAQDLPFLAWLQNMGQTKVPPHLILSLEQAAGLFAALKGHPRVFIHEDPLRIDEAPLRLPLKLEPKGEDKLRLTIEKPDNVRIVHARANRWAYLIERQILLQIPKVPKLEDRDREDLFGRGGGHSERSWKWFIQHAEGLENAFRLDTTALTRMPKLQTAPPRFRLTLEGSLNHLAGQLTCHYGDIAVTPGQESVADAEQFPFPTPEKPWEWNQRHLAAEHAATQRLEQAGFSEPDRSGQRALRTENHILRFFASVLPQLQRDWDVTIGERFTHMTRDIERITPVMTTVPHAEGGWLDVDIGYATASEQTLPKHEIQRLLQVGQSHTRLKNGKRVAIDLQACEELTEVLQDADPEQNYGSYRIPASQEDYLTQTIGAFAGREIEPIPQADFPNETLADLKEILRDYQKEGVCWMLARTSRGLSGILADEMGLGKTLQSLSVIQALHAHEESATSLVVCPTTLLDNWCAEAARFTPDLRVLKLHGSKREPLWKKIADYDLIVTSYGLLTRDLERFSELGLCAVFLDEASAIKNHQTKNAKAACALQARFRFALTGTPIENSVRDIWSIMHYVAPGYLGALKAFRERYEVPLANEAGAPAELKERFRRRLQPFILRRTKRRVASELPDKLEKVIHCPLTDLQRDTYTSLLRAGREQILDARQQSEGAARMTMLTTLLRLRQVCCDLRLLGEPSKEAKIEQLSAKLAVVHELMDEAAAGGHRVLLFSQFVSMLQILREDLEKRGIPFCYLDGQTKERGAEVNKFQNTDSVSIFLISLKAGGYGLNLTAADTVIHFDPWWNPAVEAQATDRAHRIGQQNVVTAYKLIAEDTVEEKILRLQRKKREIIDAALDDEQPLMQGLTMGDLADVLDI